MFKLVSVNTVEGLGADARRAAVHRHRRGQATGLASAAIHAAGLPVKCLAVCWRVGTGFANEFNATCCAAAAVPVGTGATRNGVSVDVKIAIGKFYAKTVR